MLANDFEKEVEQRLAQLQMRPSDGVWQKLEAGLQKKKRRRAFFLFFLTALLCTGGGFVAWQQLNPTQPQMVNVSNTNTTNDKNKLTTKDVAGEEDIHIITVIDTTIDSKNDVLIKPPAIPTTNDNVNTLTNKTATNNVEVATVNNQPKNKKIIVANSNNNNKANDEMNDVAVKQVTVKDDVVTNNSIIEASENKDADVITKHQLTTASNLSDKSIVNITDDNNTTDINLDIASIPQRIATQDEIVKTAKKKYPFYWGVEVMAGVSGAVDKAEGVNKNAQLDAPTNNYSGSVSPMLNNRTIWESQNTHRASTAHSFGIVGYKQLTRRNAISVGLSYQYLSTISKIGDSSTTVSNSANMRTYYYGRELKNHINKFHFISVPVTHHLILNKNENMPFSWDLGASVSRLISTNALVASSYLGGSFHEDDKAFTKTHFFIHTGFTIGLTNNKNRIWQMGPVLNYGVNKIGQLKGDDKNFWEVGIKLRCLLQ